jgi:hypothetical protein
VFDLLLNSLKKFPVCLPTATNNHTVTMRYSFHKLMAMRIAAIQLFLFCSSLLQPVKAQDLIYAKGFSNAVPQGGNIENRAIAVDAAGNKYVLGRFQLTADFDLGAGVQDLTAAGNYDIYLAKYDAANNYVWAKRIGGSAQEQGYALAVDASGNCYITGSFTGTADFDPNTGTQNLTAAGSSYDIFVAKYDAAGNYVWARNIGGTSDDYGLGLAIDATGNCYFTGYFQGTNVDFDADAATTQYLSSNGGSIDIFLAKYDAAGGYVWAKRIGGTSTDQGYAVAVDASGNSYITGHFQGANVDFDPNAGTQNLSSTGVSDIFLAKYDASGNHVWARKMGGTSSEIGYAIAVDASGNSYITGQFEGSNADFDPDATNTQILSSNIGSVDLFFAKYDASGNYVWAKSIGGLWSDYGRAIAVDGLGNCYVTGDFRGSADFDPGAGAQNLSGSSYTNDIFIAKYDASGAYVWAKSVGTDSGADGGYGLALDATGNNYSTGSFVGTADFDPGAGTASLSGSTSLTNNGYILQLNSSGNYVSAMAGGFYSPYALSDYGMAIKVDASGNSYVLGTFMGTVDFDAAAAVQYLTSAGSEDIFLAKYDATG